MHCPIDYWGEPEQVPHLRDERRFCLYVDIYMRVCHTSCRIFLFDPAKMATVREQCNIRSTQLHMTC